MRPSPAPYIQTPRLGAPTDTALVRSNPAHSRRQIAQICGDRIARPSPFPDRCDTGILSVCDALCTHFSTRADFTLACVDLRSSPGRPDPGSTTVTRLQLHRSGGTGGGQTTCHPGCPKFPEAPTVGRRTRTVSGCRRRRRRLGPARPDPRREQAPVPALAAPGPAGRPSGGAERPRGTGSESRHQRHPTTPSQGSVSAAGPTQNSWARDT